ncbi:hypothetical protein TI03_06000, partial [Achromatium sp. WMS1]
MSEYQYYEFIAIDAPLTEQQQNEVTSLSLRTNVTANRAIFTYDHGEFRGNVEQLMSDYFDMMLYLASWGEKRLLIRVPLSLIDMSQVAQYCISEEIDHWKTKDQQKVVLDLNFADAEDNWVKGEGLLDKISGIRTEIISNDYRVLYLTWLKAAKNALQLEDIEDDTLEPTIPSGLNQLTASQQAFIKLMNIDENLIAVAAQHSTDDSGNSNLWEEQVKYLSDEDKTKFIIKVLHGETNITSLLKQHLRQISPELQEKS